MKTNKDPQLCKEILELATKEELCDFIIDQLDGNHWMQTDFCAIRREMIYLFRFSK